MIPILLIIAHLSVVTVYVQYREQGALGRSLLTDTAVCISLLVAAAAPLQPSLICIASCSAPIVMVALYYLLLHMEGGIIVKSLEDVLFLMAISSTVYLLFIGLGFTLTTLSAILIYTIVQQPEDGYEFRLSMG